MTVYIGGSKIKDTGEYGVYLCSQNTNCLTYTPKNINLTLDPLNVTVVGSPTASNGVVSGFNSSTYVHTINSLPSWTTLEIVVKFNTGSSVSGSGWLGTTDNKLYKCQIYSGYLNLAGTGKIGTFKFETNTNYWIKTVYTTSNVSYYISTNGIDYTLDVTKSYTGGVTGKVIFGWFESNRYLSGGSVDLVNSYIKVNDSIWWKGGTGRLTLKKGSKVYVPNGFDAVRYYKYTYADWTQPVLTADGVLGGDSFAVYADPTNTDHPAYYAFDSSTSTYAVTHGADYIIYNKNPINITKIDMTVRGSSYNYRGGTLYGSNDNSNWKEIIALSALTNGSWDISSNTGYYKYYKFSGSAGDWQPKTLTLTATQQTGSVESTADDYDYTVGSGQMKFDEVVIENDRVIAPYETPANNIMLFAHKHATTRLYKDYCTSGNTYTSVSANWTFWYDTANNKIKLSSDGGVTWDSDGWSLPLGIASCSTANTWTSIDQIFDWCGYIGSTAFVLPGVKGLIPNGFNADGTYKSIEFETSKVAVSTFTISTYTGNYIGYMHANGFISYQAIDYYDKSTNTMTNNYQGTAQALSGYLTAGVNTSLTPYTVQSENTYIPIKEIYNGSQLVYQIAAFAEPTILYNNGNIGAVTWTQQCPKGIYQLSLAGGGQAASTGYYYWPAGNRGSVLVCTFELKQPSLISVTLGVGGAAYGGGGGNTVFTIDGKTAVTCPGNGGTIIIDNSAINILSTITNNTGGGGGGSGSNPTPLSPWGDGGYTNSAAGRGGGMKLEWLRLK